MKSFFILIIFVFRGIYFFRVNLILIIEKVLKVLFFIFDDYDNEKINVCLIRL